MKIRVMVFWVVTPYSDVVGRQQFRSVATSYSLSPSKAGISQGKSIGICSNRVLPPDKKKGRSR